MTEATSTVEVDVPIRTAYNQWTQFETFPEFMQGVKSVEQLDDTTTHWVFRLDGVKREFDAKIIEQEPDRHIEWFSIGELKQGGRVEFESLGEEKTRVTLTLKWEPEGFVEKAGEVLQVDDTLAAVDLRLFKAFIEKRGVEEGGWRGEIEDGMVEADPNE